MGRAQGQTQASAATVVRRGAAEFSDDAFATVLGASRGQDPGSRPDRIERTADGARVEQWLDSDRRPHRDDAPAVIVTAADGERVEEYFQHGAHARPNGGPHRVISKTNGTVIEQRLDADGLLHANDSTPSEVETYLAVRTERYHEHGALHRDGAPAVLKHGRLRTTEYFYEHGRRVAPAGPFQFNGDFKDLEQVAEFLPAFQAELAALPGFRYNDAFKGRIPGIGGDSDHEDSAIYLLQQLERGTAVVERAERLLADGWQELDPNDVASARRPRKVALFTGTGEWHAYPEHRLVIKDGVLVALMPKGKRSQGRVTVRRTPRYAGRDLHRVLVLY